ncbi:hypothetical protein Leryth_020905 [Lithospermum erythrorhizon]|nr:hypothetical protein Leryth_020905 [Lithospermum erythrorhizon]
MDKVIQSFVVLGDNIMQVRINRKTYNKIRCIQLWCGPSGALDRPSPNRYSTPSRTCVVSQALPRLTNREEVVKMVDPAIHAQFPNKDLIQVAAIAAMCIQTEADYRPLMTDVVQSLVPLVKNYSSGSASISNSYRFTPRVSPRSSS